MTVDYVALGDSYAAGVGAGTETGACRTTAGAFPVLWAADKDKVHLTLAACSAATSADVIRTQLDKLTADTDLVSVTVGANDLGLTDTLRLCATAPQGEACTTALARIPQALATTVPAGVGELLTRVRVKAPKAKLVVTGYPVPFADAAQCPGLPLPAALRTAGTAAITGLNQVLAATAAAAKATFVDVSAAFAGHAQCTPEPWLVGAEGLGNETVLHPTLVGQTKGFLPAFVAQAGSVDEIIAWIQERDGATTPPSGDPTTSPSPTKTAGGAVAAPHQGGGGGGLPVTGPGVGVIVGVGLLLIVAGVVGFTVWRPRRVRVVSE
ncbi:SGNH/GDSL hydrolase family protein [Actinoplanes sp. NPDC049265]|uniref:SGNH/GDSL hydrolase family protein n=1 Tax=Actinoplanes sp. NPDC049265 TaxID=3363902 RepID=UPI003711D88C